jgi:hypothetical protein
MHGIIDFLAQFDSTTGHTPTTLAGLLGSFYQEHPVTTKDTPDGSDYRTLRILAVKGVWNTIIIFHTYKPFAETFKLLFK